MSDLSIFFSPKCECQRPYVNVTMWYGLLSLGVKEKGKKGKNFFVYKLVSRFSELMKKYLHIKHTNLTKVMHIRLGIQTG